MSQNIEDDIDIAPTPDFVPQGQPDYMNSFRQIIHGKIDKLAEGERTTLKALQQEIQEQITFRGMGNITPVISMIVRERNDITIELGRYGGIYKGIRTKAAKEPDTRARCEHCHQVIRQKTGPRKKKIEAKNEEPSDIDSEEESFDEDMEDEESSDE